MLVFGRLTLATEAIYCRSQTDAEVVAHLVGLHYDDDRNLACASRTSLEHAEHAEHVFDVPCLDSILQAPLAVLPLQLFPYHVARERELNVDRPRNLAKTVTVE
jgi:glucosamine 6-phosphate synthetase-like amidotransferase/phosphosugar isomerase protein